MNFADTLRSYIGLTKPTIVVSFALTGAVSMVMEGSLLAQPLRFCLVLLSIIFTAASANGLNQYFERDLDAQMERTRKRRPLPLQKMKPIYALWFSILLGVLATFYLLLMVNWLSALLAIGTILFYALFYTLWLKARTPYNIVIGGAAGATAPLIGWAAATGQTSLAAWILFFIIFMWTPPHFWALALCVKDQYAKAGIPMLPVVKGEERTRSEIWWYTLLLFPFALSLVWFNISGWFYAISGSILNIIFIYKAWQNRVKKSPKVAYQLFGYSIIYLILLFVLMLVDNRV